MTARRSATARLTTLDGARVLVTGGCGLIGRPTVAALQAEGAVVTVLDRVASDADVRSIVGDVTDPAVLAEAVAGQDAVVHLGGYAGLGMADAVETYRVNAVGSFAVFAAAAGAGAAEVVYASSINANGYPLGAEQVLPPVFPYSEDAQPRISDEYSLSKLATEDAARMAHATWGLSLTGLRYPLVRDITVDGGRVFGAHLRAVLAADPRRQAAEGWSYLDAADSARAVLAALLHETPPAPGILVAAPLTYLRGSTADALDAIAPDVPRGRLEGRAVGLDLTRSRELLGFEARVLLDDVAPQELADVAPAGSGA
ncbi:MULTISPECIES: NAD(P)-dependent oxidoreductase [unclassified Rathayibacter]|uniref:NAD-dependent epimerase/dehydratase family protein n=1 Tax=unclassified Rathayibacter TaxID=2609250 RepID=UPI0010486D4D|nr:MULTISPECIES: NAD(P)-dependent oxidoreductase [unclassified Rathayibacter]TCL83235.1 nucleoside-diphosphate-sugar epimerase [Rathayibacter sp. PhB192]TCM28733.1 nucleoside-diphosphate-sugar epimerase [Rathayibacter sp. PhB179]